MKITLIYLVLTMHILFASNCAPYFNPERFYNAPEFLEILIENKKIDFKNIEFNIEQKELYRFKESDIASEINDNFGGFWNDWIEDGYEMQLVPETTLFRYKDNYFSLQVFIYGVVGDATKLNNTIVKYHFYNYTEEVNKHILCKKDEM